MKMFSTTGIAVTALGAMMAMSIQAQAAPLTIDDFTTAQAAVTDATPSGVAGSGSTGSVSSGGGDILGGQRDVYVQMLTGGNDAEAAFNAGGTGTFSFNSGSGVTAMAILQYDGLDGGAVTNAAGTGNANALGGAPNVGVDLSAHNGIQIDIIENDKEIISEIILYSGAGNYAIHQFTKDEVVFGATFHHVVDFVVDFPGGCVGTGAVSGLACTAGTGFDLTNITAIEVWIEGVSSNDLTLDFVQTTVPEPATIALMGVGLLGMGVARRRRQSRA